MFFVGNKGFTSWRDALEYGKKLGESFDVRSRSDVVASWSPADGFWFYQDPDAVAPPKFAKAKPRIPTVLPVGNRPT